MKRRLLIIPQSGKSSSDGDSDIFLLFPRKEQTNNNSVVASIVYVLLEIANAFIDKIPFVNIKYYRRFFRTMSIIILIKINIRKYVKYLKKCCLFPGGCRSFQTTCTRGIFVISIIQKFV